MSIARRATSEAVGTMLLLAAIVGSGIMAERLAAGNVALALLANAVATGCALVAIIGAFGPLSGAHLNPIVTFVEAWRRGLAWRDVPAYAAAQIAGAILGVVLANVLFGLPPLSISHHERSGWALVASESLATFGLVAVIWGSGRAAAPLQPIAVGAYITAAYWFTPSTSFANPAVTVARSLTDTFTGIGPDNVLPFIFGQLGGAVAACALFAWLVPRTYAYD